MMKLQFEASPNGNILWGEDDKCRIYAEVEVPEGASEDYGYLSMKNAILEELERMGKKIDLAFWYDGQEQYLAEDADVDADVRVEIVIAEEEPEMTTEYAIINANIENVPEEDAAVIIKAQDAQDIVSKLAELEADGEDMDEYTVEEYKVDTDGEFAEGSDYDTVENFRKRFGTWYAVQSDTEDTDWGTGSYELAEAKRMVAQYPAGRIAVIDMTGSEPMCIGYEEV